MVLVDLAFKHATKSVRFPPAPNFLMHARVLAAALLLAALSIGISLSATLPHARAAFLPQSVTRTISPNERNLVKSSWKGEPLRVNTVKLGGNTTEFGKAFTDADDDWLNGLALNVTNTSDKDIVFIGLTLTFFTEETKPRRVPVEYPVSYGSAEGIFDGSTTAHPVRPNESFAVTLTDEEYEKLKEILINNHYPTVFHHVDLRLDTVVFADGLLWYKGHHFNQDRSKRAG